MEVLGKKTGGACKTFYYLLGIICKLTFMSCPFYRLGGLNCKRDSLVLFVNSAADYNPNQIQPFFYFSTLLILQREGKASEETKEFFFF